METRIRSGWSELPMDILRSLLERLSFADFLRAKVVCSNWFLCSKQTLNRKNGSPWLMLFPEDGCALYNQEEDRVYRTERDFSGIRFLANSGKWFLVLDSRSNLYIIDVFSDKRIDLPPLESAKGGLFVVERVRDNGFRDRSVLSGLSSVILQTAEDLRGVLWVDDKKGEYVVVWKFEYSEHMRVFKKGDVHYREIPTRAGVRRELQDLSDMVLKGYSLYVRTACDHIRHLDLSGQYGFKDVSKSHRFPMRKPNVGRNEIGRIRANKVISYSDNIAVTTSSGEVLMVHTNAYESTFARRRRFILYKRDPNDLATNYFYTEPVEVKSLGDEALFLDLGITVPADSTLGIEPNSIYFARDDRFFHKKPACVDICVYNLATKTIKRFPTLSNFKLKDARWFLPS